MTQQLVARPRLVELMHERWRRRVVLVVGGPGFGKSVLLRQAIAENALAPRGTDVVVQCTEADSAPSHLLRRIADVAGIATPQLSTAPAASSWIVGELARRWPLGMCLLLDDAHHVARSDDGVRLLTKLITEAPPSVHFVLASRTPMRGLARLRAAGDAVEITEAQLSLSCPEIAALAAAHGVNPSVPASVGGWPAAASMAAMYGIDGAEEYVFEAVLDHLTTAERSVLAIAAAIGGGDRALLREAVGESDVEPYALLRGLPLVQASERGEIVIHDLWRSILAGSTEPTDVAAAVRRAITELTRREDFDRAFRLCVDADDWGLAGVVLTACCRHGHVTVPADVVAEWLDLLPRERWEDADALLLRGLVGRVRNPFSDDTARMLRAAVDCYRASGNVAGEVAAGVALVQVLRNQGRTEELPAFFARVAELDAAGHSEAAGPAAMARALAAELSGDDRLVIEMLEAVPAGSLSHDWETVAAFRRTVSQFSLGNEAAMLEAAQRCADLAGPSNEGHILALAQWFTGDPRPALTGCDEIAVDAAPRVDDIFFGVFAATVLASAGRVDEAAEWLAGAERAATGPLSALLGGALIGAQALVAAARGDDEAARRLLVDALSASPLDQPSGWRLAIRWLPLAYVLVPATRDFLDERVEATLHARRVAVGRAVAWAREGASAPPPPLDGLTPGTVCTSVPLPWAMTLASRLSAWGKPEGREIAESLLELFGEPAKRALRRASEDPRQGVVDGARKLLAAIPTAPRQRVRLDVLGPTLLRVGDEELASGHWSRERVRSLLIYLVLHGPARREQIIDALWPHLDLRAADRNLRVTLTYLHQVLEPHRQGGEAPFFIQQHGPTLTLAGGPHLQVDLRDFERFVEQAEDAEHRGLPTLALQLFEQAAALWRGPCLTDVAYEEWAQTACRELTARYVHATLRAGELHLAAGRTHRAATMARRALAADEWCEAAYCILIAAALARSDRSAARVLLAEADAMLDGLGIRPGPQLQMLRRRWCSGEERLVLSAIA